MTIWVRIFCLSMMTGRYKGHEGVKYQAIGIFEAGMKVMAIARRLNVSNPNVRRWVKRFFQHGNVERP